jgi:hypothetical protein
MKRIYLYITSLPFLLLCFNAGAQDKAQDSVIFPLKLRAGIEVSGPVIYLTDKRNKSFEGYFSADLNEKYAVYLAGGYSDFKYSQYNYDYQSTGAFFRTGVDINFIKPETSMGKYWGGLGIHYGVAVFSSETPRFSTVNYWGTSTSSISRQSNWGHYIEVSPGFRAELFKNFSIGWTVNLRKLLFFKTKNDIRPIFIPGYGDGGKKFSSGIGYYIVWNIPFKKIRVAIKQEPPEEPEEPQENETQGQNSVR